jgi:N-acetyl-anhydromuramyl-L-alanine amidase AmpD
MLKEMVKINKIPNLKSSGKSKKKTQIILCHTSRDVTDYLNSLKNRHNGNFNRLPNYVIDRNGTIYETIPSQSYSEFFKDSHINKNSIIICFENLGWLEKIPLSNEYVNWIGDIYKGEVIEKKWRDYFYWQPYTENQISSCVELCKNLLDAYSINKQCIGHNTKIENVDKFCGIVSKSNFSTDYTDLSPAFNFDFFQNKLKNE